MSLKIDDISHSFEEKFSKWLRLGLVQPKLVDTIQPVVVVDDRRWKYIYFGMAVNVSAGNANFFFGSSWDAAYDYELCSVLVARSQGNTTAYQPRFQCASEDGQSIDVPGGALWVPPVPIPLMQSNTIVTRGDALDSALPCMVIFRRKLKTA